MQLFAPTAAAADEKYTPRARGGSGLEAEGTPREPPLPMIDTAAPQHSTPLAAVREGDGVDEARKKSGDRSRARSPWDAIINDYLLGGDARGKGHSRRSTNTD